MDNINKTRILISNDGIGSESSNRDGLGLIGIAERVDQIQGSLEISKKKLFKIIINLSN
jgi:signal transduction histidine kinase